MTAESRPLAVSAATPQAADAARVLDQVSLIRAVEERLLALFAEGRLYGTTHTCIGQELCAVAVVGALDLERDIVFAPHRCHGHYLVYAGDPDGLIAEIMGRESGVCGGRGGSQHLCHRNFYSNGIQGGIVPVTTGMALAEKLAGTGAIAVCFLGDGTTGEGVIYEAFNLASLWQVPVLYVLEHNGYAQSTPTSRTIAGDVTARAAAFGIATDERDATDGPALVAHMATVVERIRRTNAPFFQVLHTNRMAAHSKGDDDRNPEELARARAGDPLIALRASVGTEAADASRLAAEARVDRAVALAEASPVLEIDAIEEERRLAASPAGEPMAALARPQEGDPPLVVQNLNQALHGLLGSSDRIVLLGEDLADPYGGAFKVSRGLSTRFPGQVFSTPISEAGIVGVAGGLSLRGFRPVVEIMFGDFITLCADQIVNHLAKFRWMYNDQVRTPVVIRMAVGGRRGYGPTHSQCLEKMMLGVPGLAVVAISLRHDAGELLRRAVADDDRPVLFVEQKFLYARRLQPQPPIGLVLDLAVSERTALYPTPTWRPAFGQADVTVVTYGAMTEVVEQALARSFAEDELVAEYLVPAELAPLRIDPILESVGRTGRLLVVEEGTAPWGFGAEVVARVAEHSTSRSLRCARVGAHHLPIPNARPAEDAVLPDVARIMAAMRGLVS